MSNKYLLVISKNYTDISEQNALFFLNTFSEILHIPNNQIIHLIRNNITLSNIKTYIYNFIKTSLLNQSYNPILYIYINNYTKLLDTNGNELNNHNYNSFIVNDLTEIINSAVYYSNTIERPLIVFISESITLLDKLNINYFDWISIGLSEKEFNYENMMSTTFINALLENVSNLNKLTTLEFYNLLISLDNINNITLHISNKLLLDYQLFK